ncbi:kinase-like domain, phloem protein 2-like protein [Tanacetum coccineum]|uniref:Kinase-like domain, phloem protein 2-like protein n=1 Tax=Tanacetum coccineum TaxID=301880 RepID=A0ABQ5JBX5_9ASTR
MSLPSNEFAHLQVPLQNILSTTNNFAEENVIREYEFVKEYKGQLLWSGELIDITAKRFNKDTTDREQVFWMEISMLSRLKHKNVVSLVGFCDENDEKIIIIRNETARGMLSKYLSDSMSLTWVRRLEICVGLAHALSYIHYDEPRDFSVIHRAIECSRILLNDKWEPKLSGFEHSMKIKASQRHHSFHTNRVKGVKGYVDPTCLETGTGSLTSISTHVESHVNKETKSFLRDISHLKLGFQDIASATNNFAQKSIMRTFKLGIIYKGRILHSEQLIDIFVKRHSDDAKVEAMCWSCKVANALSYIHYDAGRDFSVIHCNVRSSEILLDDDWEPKLSGFELALKNTVARRHRLILTRDVMENIYMDPKYKKTGGVTHKSDVYSLGVVLFEVLCGRSAVPPDEALGQGLLSQLSNSYLDDMLDKHLRNQMDGEALKIFSETAYCCIKEERADRPHIDQVVKGLETALKLQLVYENRELQRNAVDSTSSYHLRWKNLEHLKIGLDVIEMATEKFADKYCIGSGGFGTVYKAQLEHFDSSNSSSTEGKNKCDLPKKRSMVAIKRINSPNGERGFNVEIETLTSCKHENIISLLGFCDEDRDHMILVYELASKESLRIIWETIDESANILLGEKWEAKIADFGLSILHPADQDASTFDASTIAGTPILAYFDNGIAPIARHHFEKGTLMEIVDRKIKEETDEHVFSLSKGPDKESLEIFSEIAFRCLAETQVQRPTIDVVINELKRALKCQENHKDNLKLSLEDIKLATQSFSQDNLIGHGDLWNVYKGNTHGHNIIAAKRLDRKSAEGEAEFMTELEILMEYKHENVIGLVGYIDEEDEKIIVYDYASRGSLDKYLSDDSLTWVMRLKICLDIAIGLEYLHGSTSSPEMVIHRDISSSNILLFDDWKAKITDFGLSLVCPTNEDVGFVIDKVTGTIGYRDPLYSKTGFLTKESDIFSLGAVLFDILCGKLSSEKLDDEYLYLPFLAKHHYHVETLDKRERRPTAHELVIQLKKALEFQEDYYVWKPKLPKDYKEIIQMSKCPEINSTIKKEDLYNIFSKGILLQQDKLLLSFVGNGERNEMVSATMFSYINSCPHEWKYLPESRFGTVVKILDISNLFIEIKTRAQFLSRNVVYGVYLVFKFCESRMFASKPMYIDLNYTKGHESLNAYFATWRDNDWMMIELYRFLNKNEDVVFEFLLECFSSLHYGDGAVYVEGIEFRAIENVKHEIGKLAEGNQVLKTNFADQVLQLSTNFEEIFKISRNYDELFWLGEVNGKKLLMVSAKAALYKFSNVNLFTSTPSAQSRLVSYCDADYAGDHDTRRSTSGYVCLLMVAIFQEVIELLPQRVFHINCTIKSQMLSPDTEYVCYLLFKLSENCQGMHRPVKVRDVLHQENNGAGFFYFSTPSPVNIHDITRVPKQREDGWMEIQVWKFNSACEFKDDSLSMNMKFASHEVPMSGLIVCGLEFRPL